MGIPLPSRARGWPIWVGFRCPLRFASFRSSFDRPPTSSRNVYHGTQSLKNSGTVSEFFKDAVAQRLAPCRDRYVESQLSLLFSTAASYTATAPLAIKCIVRRLGNNGSFLSPIFTTMISAIAASIFSPKILIVLGSMSPSVHQSVFRSKNSLV